MKRDKRVVTLNTVKKVDFEFHCEKGEIVIDKCEGISPEAGLATFDDWVIEAMLEESRREG